MFTYAHFLIVQNKDTALMIASCNGNCSIVAVLLKVQGIDLNVKNTVSLSIKIHQNALVSTDNFSYLFSAIEQL